MSGFRLGIAGALSLLAITGCGESSAPQTAFSATLRGASEVPPVTTTATGTATFTVTGGSITYSVTWSGLSGNATASHIHVAAAGATGPVRLNLCGTGAPVPACPTGAAATLTGTATDTYLSGITMVALLEQIRNFTAYVNVHTAANSGGEIRGQLVGS